MTARLKEVETVADTNQANSIYPDGWQQISKKRNHTSTLTQTISDTDMKTHNITETANGTGPETPHTRLQPQQPGTALSESERDGTEMRD